ncbi:hypothetical protein [Streptomyces lavendulae]|uniref:hypothetical protein n=1 Tax=Streptomyces lavendulae TaxID=1914 RepID=UPI0031EE3EF1
MVNGDLNTVQLVETTNNGLFTSVPVGRDPRGMAFTSDGSRAYVTNAASDNVSVIDTVTHTVRTAVPVASPEGIVIGPNGYGYVQTGSLNTLDLIDTETNGWLGSMPVSDAPLNVAIAPDGLLYFTGNALTRMYPGNPLYARRIGFPGEDVLRGLALSPDGTRAYVLGRASMYVVDTRIFFTVSKVSIDEAPTMVALSPDGKRAYLAYEGLLQENPGRVSVIETATNTVAATISVDPFPRVLAVTPDSARTYLTHATGTMTVIDNTTNSAIGSVQLGGSPLDVKFAPQG